MAEYIDSEKLRQAMFQETFVKDSDLQRWDSGCWIRYKLFENVLEKTEVADVQPVKWIPVKSRPMDEEERKEWSEKIGYDIEYEDAVIYTSQLPDDGQEVLTCNRYGTISIDKFQDDEFGCYFEENGDMDGIIAWMPLPEPPKEE